MASPLQKAQGTLVGAVTRQASKGNPLADSSSRRTYATKKHENTGLVPTRYIPIARRLNLPAMHSSARQPVSPKGPDGLATNDLTLPSMSQSHQQPQDLSPLAAAATAAIAGAEPISAAFPAAPPPLMHFPHCRLDITHIPSTHNDGTASASSPGKIEQVALPGALVRTLLSRFEESQQPSFPTPPPTPPSPSSSLSSAYGGGDDRERKTTVSASSAPKPLLRMRIQRHFDDADDWVFSRCLLADFAGFREDETEALSAQGQLCCWASVVLQPQPQSQSEGEEHGVGMWELGFVVQRVGVTDPGSGWCECF